MTAIEKDSQSVKHASKNLKDNFQIALKAVKKNWYALYDLSFTIRKNKQIALIAIR
jgi:hypothetical protein